MKRPFIVGLLALALACGDDDEDSGNTSYLPTAEGSYWVYNGTSLTEGEYTQTNIIKGTRVVGDLTCQVMETTYSYDEGKITRSFFVDNDLDTYTLWGEEIVDDDEGELLKEYDAGLPIYDYPFVVGDEWEIFSGQDIFPTQVPLFSNMVDDVNGDGLDDRVNLIILAEVEGVDDVEVPYGVVEGCYRLRLDLETSFFLSTGVEIVGTGFHQVWYKPGIGPVKWHFNLDWPDPVPDRDEEGELVDYALY